MESREIIEALVNRAADADGDCPAKDEADGAEGRAACAAPAEGYMMVPVALLRRTAEALLRQRIHCAECKYCYMLPGDWPKVPYNDTGDGSFHCDFWDMEFYAPRYRAETYFCGDAEEREEAGKTDKG